MNETQNTKNKKWIIIIAVCSLLLIACELLISQYVSLEFSKTMLNQRKSSISQMAHLAYNSIKPLLSDVHSGRVDSAAARSKIVDLVRNMTYEDEYGKNYIFMSTYDGTMLVQPFEPLKEGSDQWEMRDSNGKYTIQKLIEAAKKNPEGAFISYDYYLPDKEKVEEKLSYVIGIPEIDAYIGTGMYLDSAYEELGKVLDLQLYGFLLVMVFVIGAAVLYIRLLIHANHQLSTEIKEKLYAEDNIRTVFDSIHDTVILHDDNGNILQANKRAGILFGIPENLMIKYSIPQLCADGYCADEKLEQARNLERASFLFEWKFKRPHDGHTFDGEVAMRRSMWSGRDVIVSVIRDISERKKHEDEVRHLAYYDYLTSLHNRVYIMNELLREFDWEREKQAEGAILFIDLDNFKKINDSYGHFFGDEVLIELAERLKSICEKDLLPARIGGDEFVILCYGADKIKATESAQLILQAFRKPIMLRQNPIYVTCSIGISLYPKDGETVEELFKKADLAMYNAKDNGKDGYSFYEEVMSEELKSKSELEEQLRCAYENREFVLYFQPMFNIKTRMVSGYEALIRWNSPKYGFVPPDKMIPLAEEMGLINKIGDWVIDQAFSFAKEIQENDFYVSCNVSSIQLLQTDFVNRVFQKFDEYQILEGSVALEITESCLIESFDGVSEKLAQLRRKGIKVYLDDFGTGYSSLNYLKNLPIDNIKIDKSFIDEIVNSGADSKILKTIISLAHELGMKTVAEGVETPEQLHFLSNCGCDLIQGYIISKPEPEDEIKKRIYK